MISLVRALASARDKPRNDRSRSATKPASTISSVIRHSV